MGEDSRDMAFRLRKIIFYEWRSKRLTWQEVKARYGLSKAWFYKFRSRFLKYGDDGLKDKIRKVPLLAHYLAWDQKIKVDFFVNHIFNNTPPFKIRGVITDQAVEFYYARHKNDYSYFRPMINRCGVEHTVTKRAHLWTNGYAERLNQTIWQEFYLCMLPRPYATLAQLNEDLQKFMREYNFKRMHTGYKLVERGYRSPAHAFFDIRENSNIVEIKY
ncbi:MAG: integrase core domain-containing protein [Candidatus Omnitrophica bacterium]|nr:integrase core domain-containing protein [Candidatus Omnitrophota bacterium]MCM8790749.1 integrase core domain-containing protein [Candidatus Omnitrophota bacterium]